MNSSKNRTPVFLLLPLSILIAALLAGCGGSAGAGSAKGETVAAHDIQLPNGVESVIPFPAEATVRTSMNLGENGHSIVFSPGISWPDAVSFFSEKLAAGQWTVTNEYIPEKTEGERSARWEAEGHGITLNIEVTAFGGHDGFNMNGIMLVRELE